MLKMRGEEMGRGSVRGIKGGQEEGGKEKCHQQEEEGGLMYGCPYFLSKKIKIIQPLAVRLSELIT